MEVVRIVTGNWFPRTKLHLREYYTFLKKGTSHLPIDKKRLHEIRNKMMPDTLSYVGLAVEGRFDHVDASFGNIHTSYFEDGLMIAWTEQGPVHDALYGLHAFYKGRLLTTLSTLFSVGIPAIIVHDPKYADRPTVFVVRRASDAEIHQFAESFDDEIHFTATHKRHRIYFADTMIVVATTDVHSDFTRHLVEAICFFREFETRLNNFLNLHREIWSSIEQIRARPFLNLKELPQIRDRLLDYNRDLSIIVACLAQMRHFLDERSTEIDESGWSDDFRALEAYRFGKMLMSVNYLYEQWIQLGDYMKTSAEIVGLMYDEQFQRELKVEQFIFLVGSVASVVILGSMSGFGFFLSDFVFFGIATILGSSLIFYSVKTFFSARFYRMNPMHALGQRTFSRHEMSHKKDS